MFVIILSYLQPLEIVDQYLVEHRNYLEEGYKKNQFIASGPQNPRNGGILLSQVKDRDQLMNIIKKDPFYIHKIAEYNIIEFNPVKYHPNFSNFIE